MLNKPDQKPAGLHRLAALSQEHQRGIMRFKGRLAEFTAGGLVTSRQAGIVEEHLLRLGERGRNPANTGNIEDLFCHTLTDTRDPIRAYAQALADSVKVVPLESDALLWPAARTVDGKKHFLRVSDFGAMDPGDKMLVTHTMIAYGDEEMRASAAEFARATRPNVDEGAVRREVARMAVQSQHHPSSTFVLARAAGLTIEIDELYREAGYETEQIIGAQRFYSVCAEYQPHWANDFMKGDIPLTQDWLAWRKEYLAARQHLPAELVYQLASDTLTNFHEATLESGKWTDATVMFGGVTSVEDLPRAIARIVNQYIAEHVALHDRPAQELTVACAAQLRPWGIGFESDRAVALPEPPEKAAALKVQFEAAWARKTGHHLG